MRCVQKCLSLKSKSSKQRRDGWFCSRRHQNSNYARAGEMYTFWSDSAKSERLYKSLMCLPLSWIHCSVGVHVFSQDFYCLSNPSWIKHAGVISTACCCIISIIHKARACNLIPSVIFTATKAGQGKVKLWRRVHSRRLSVWFVACSSSILHMLFGKKTKKNQTPLYIVWDSHWEKMKLWYQRNAQRHVRLVHEGTQWQWLLSWPPEGDHALFKDWPVCVGQAKPQQEDQLQKSMSPNQCITRHPIQKFNSL